MNHTQSYTINGCIFQEFLMLLGKVVHSDLIRQMEYLKVENEILRSKCPKRITTTPAEKRKLIKYGLACRSKIKGIISIVNYSTFRRWVNGDIRNKYKPAKQGRPRKTSHKEELEFHKKRIEILNAQKTKLENRLHQIYIDRIDGKVSEEFFDEMTDKWQAELSQIKEQIGRHENSDSNYLSQGVHILELCNKAHSLYLQQAPLKRAKLLHYILSNCTLDGVTLSPTYRKPFGIIAKGLSRQDWLPEHRRNPNFCIELILGLTNARSGSRWIAIY